MDHTVCILPVNTLPIEDVLEQVAVLTLKEIDVDSLRRMRDPYLTSVSHLPFLAWGRGVDLWRDNWPEWKKRRITAEIYGMKGLKGTLPGIDKYLSYVDAEIYDAVIPPVGVFLIDQPRESLELWKSQFPELRLYPYSIPGERPCFAIGNGLRTVPGYVGGFFMLENPAARYYGRRATIVEEGVEREIRSFDQMGTWGSDAAIDVTTFAIPADASPNDTMIDNFYIGHSYISEKNRGRLITIGRDGVAGAGQIPAGIESITPLSIAPERVHQKHDGRILETFLSSESKTGVNHTFIYSDASSQHIYDRWRLLGEEKVKFGSIGLLAPFVDYSYLGLDPFTALLRVKATYRREGTWCYVGQSYVGHFHLGANTDRVDDVGEAIYKSRSMRDQIWFTTATYRPMQIDDLSFVAPQPWHAMLPIRRISL